MLFGWARQRQKMWKIYAFVSRNNLFNRQNKHKHSAVRCTYGRNVQQFEVAHNAIYNAENVWKDVHIDLAQRIILIGCVSYALLWPAAALFSFPMFSWLMLSCSWLPNCCYCTMIVCSFFLTVYFNNNYKMACKTKYLRLRNELNIAFFYFVLFILHIFHAFAFRKIF